MLFGCHWLCADEAIGVILKACVANGFNLLITADHGNAETMIDDNDNPVTKHTTNRGELLTSFNIRRAPLTYTVPASSGV